MLKVSMFWAFPNVQEIQMAIRDIVNLFMMISIFSLMKQH